MTDDIKNRILEIAVQESVSDDRVLLFDQIPPKKLKTATKEYASSLGSDETVVMLVDVTAFGSAKEGFILTSKRLYCKSFLEKAVFTDISDITSMVLSKPGNYLKIRVITSNRNFDMNIPSGLTGNEVPFLNFIDRTVRLLKTLTVASATDTSQTARKYMSRCKSCGAGNESDSAKCEYCGTAFGLETNTSDGAAYYYKEYPEAPDFGAVTGTPSLVAGHREEGTLGITYEYSREHVSQEIIDKYRNALESEGFRCCAYPNADTPFYTYMKKADDDILMGLSTINVLENHWVRVFYRSEAD